MTAFLSRARLVGLFGVVALPLLLATIWSDRASLAEREAALARERLTLARSTAYSAELLVETNVIALSALARRPEITGYSDLNELRAFLIAEAQANPYWDTLGLYDGRAINLAVSPPNVPSGSVSLADRPHVQAALSGDRPAVGNADMSRGRGVPVVSIAAPVQLASGTRGVLLGALALDRLAAELREVVSVNPGARLILVDAYGRAFVHPEQERAARLDSLVGRPAVDDVLLGYSNVIQRRVDQVELLVAYAPVPSAGWGVMLEEQASTAFAPVHRGQLQRDALLAALIAGTAALTWFLGGRIAAFQDQLDRRRAEAEAAVRVRDEFISIAAHELRSPATAIRGSAQLGLRALSRGTLEDTRAAQLLTNVVRGVDRLNVLIGDLLDVARLREGRFPIHPETVDATQLVKETVDRYELDATPSRITQRLPAEPVWITVDPARVTQVLDNLVTNAQKYSPDGGPITVTLEADAESVQLCVTDQGIGLPEGAAERIFEPFGRAANAIDRELPGLGLGLYICRQIVEAHGGSISAESPGLDRGTTMVVHFPLSHTEGSLADPRAANLPQETQDAAIA